MHAPPPPPQLAPRARSVACGHVFEKSALLNCFHGNKAKVICCPQKGCKAQCVAAELVDDEDMLELVRQYQRLQEREADEAGSGGGGGGGGGGGAKGKAKKKRKEEEEEEEE